MEKTKIAPIKCSKTIDYSQKLLSRFWQKYESPAQLPAENSNSLKEPMIAALEHCTDQIICVQTEDINDTQLITALYNASSRNRIYLLINQKTTAVKNLTGCCLIRYGIETIGSFVLIAPTSKQAQGFLCTAPFLESSFACENFMLMLDQTQITTLFRFFCDCFWNKAVYEIIEDFSAETPASEPPLDFLPNMHDFCDSEFFQRLLAEPAENVLAAAPNLGPFYFCDYRILRHSQLLIPLQQYAEQTLDRMSENGNTLYARYQPVYPHIRIAENGMHFLIPKQHLSHSSLLFALKLNTKQKTEIEQQLLPFINKPEYRYYSTGTRKHHSGQIVYFNALMDEPRTIPAYTEKQCEPVQCNALLTQAEFEKCEPSRFEDDGISCCIRYQWDIQPFYLPHTAKKAKLYEDWTIKEKQFHDVCTQLLMSIEETEHSKHTFTEGLKRFFLGKNQKFKQYKETIYSLQSKQLSAMEIPERNEVIRQLCTIAEDIQTDKTEMSNEIKKAALDAEITTQTNLQSTVTQQLASLRQKKEDGLQQKTQQIHLLEQEEAEILKKIEAASHMYGQALKLHTDQLAADAVTKAASVAE